MSTIPVQRRRRVLQAFGIGTAGAGCVSAPTQSAGRPNDDQTPAASSTNAAIDLDVNRIAANPTAVPSPITRRSPETVEAHLTTRELVSEVEPGVSYTFMTFDGRVPGPMVRDRTGDQVKITVTNHESNSIPHNIDLHAVRGPGGGAEATLVKPGETKSFQFKGTYPGLFVYHCAVPNLDYHISSGLFGAILIEPEEDLPAVDNEFYLGQHESYMKGQAGEKGHHDFDFSAMQREDPSYVPINGEKYGIGPDGYNDMQMEVGDTARVYFAVGGPNKFSSFHPTGAVWDELWPQGAIDSDPHRYVQTTPVLPGRP